MKRLLPLFILLGLGYGIQAQPTWSDDIACIIYSHCTSCHNSNGIGPFNLMNYSDAYSSRYVMENSIVNKTMPPFPPDTDYAPIAHANRLTDAEIQLFQDWVATGAPEGNPANAPTAPIFTSAAEITDPDATFTTPLYTVPSINDDLYKCFVIQTNFPEDRYISDIEIFPNNRNIVHHVLAYQNLTNDPVIDDNNDPEIGFECGGSIEGGDNVLIAEWVPGSKAWRLPEGTGIKLTTGANIVIQVHYPDYTDGQSDFLTLNMKFEDNSAGNVREVYQDQTLDHIQHLQQPFLFIPAYTSPTFTQKFVLPEARTFIGTAPHAHLLCTEMKSWAIKPDGTVVNMVHIPNWDFDWQGFYYYPEPIVLPAGTELWGEAKYDNTTNNPNNPNNPPKTTILGEDTEDEMMLFFYQYLFYENGDETLYSFSAEHEEPEIPGCNSFVSVFDVEREQKFTISPNPNRGDILHLELGTEISGNYDIQIMDVAGKQVFASSCNSNCDIALPSSLENGMYLCSISQEGQAIGRVEKLVVMR